jgi:hypothetical protein
MICPSTSSPHPASLVSCWTGALQALYAREASRAQLMFFALRAWAIVLAAFVFSYSGPSDMFFDFKKAYWESGFFSPTRPFRTCAHL